MYKLISFNLCPFVQRSAIVLNEKEMDYDVTYIDLRNKPEWFLAISPTGRVPVVQTPTGVNLFESAVINEYLDEMHPPHIFPSEPLARAQDRMWRDFMAALYGPVYMLYSAKHEADIVEQVSTIKTSLTRVEAELDTSHGGDAAGPYFYGQRFSIVDVAAAPALMRLTWVEQLAPQLSLFDGLPRVAAWRRDLLARPSIQQSVLPDIFDIFLASLRKQDSWLIQTELPAA